MSALGSGCTCLTAVIAHCPSLRYPSADSVPHCAPMFVTCVLPALAGPTGTLDSAGSCVHAGPGSLTICVCWCWPHSADTAGGGAPDGGLHFIPCTIRCHHPPPRPFCASISSASDDSEFSTDVSDTRRVSIPELGRAGMIKRPFTEPKGLCGTICTL